MLKFIIGVLIGITLSCILFLFFMGLGDNKWN